VGEVSPGLGGIRGVVVGESLAATIWGSLMAEYGAEIIKVEPPGGDPLRRLGPLVDGASLRWSSSARGLRSVTCDPLVGDGAALLQQLLDTAAVICDGAGPTDLAAAGLHLDARRSVVVRVPAMSEAPGLPGSLGDGLIGAAHGGLLHVTGHPDGPPTRLGGDVVDLLTAAYAAEASVAGLLRRHRTGHGLELDASHSGAVLRILEWTIAAFDVKGTVRRREGNFPTAVAPIGLYAASDGGLVGIVGASDANFRRLTDAMQRAELRTDERFASGALRAEHSADINKIVGEWVASLPSHEVVERCHDHGVIVAVVQRISDVIVDPHLRARGDLIELVDAAAGRVVQPAPQPHSPHHTRDLQPAPGLGTSNDAIWIQELGLDPKEYQRRRHAGVL